MKFKKLLILIIVVSLLLVLALIKNSAQKKQIIQEEITAVQPCVLTRDLATGFIQKVTIYKGDAEKHGPYLLVRPLGARSRAPGTGAAYRVKVPNDERLQ